MSAFIIHENGKSIEINSDIVPCCNTGHGEVKEVLIFSGPVYCGYCYEYRDIFSGVFWWDLVQDKEVIIK